jgi:acyl carrier protein
MIEPAIGGEQLSDEENDLSAPMGQYPRFSRQALSIIGEVMGLEKVHTDDNFIDLGGDSLTAVEVAAQLSVITGVAIEATELFETDTFGDLFQELASRIE